MPALVQVGLDSAYFQTRYTKQPSCSLQAWVGPREVRFCLRGTGLAGAYRVGTALRFHSPWRAGHPAGDMVVM